MWRLIDLRWLDILIHTKSLIGKYRENKTLCYMNKLAWPFVSTGILTIITVHIWPDLATRPRQLQYIVHVVQVRCMSIAVVIRNANFWKTVRYISLFCPVTYVEILGTPYCSAKVFQYSQNKKKSAMPKKCYRRKLHFGVFQKNGITSEYCRH
jgi:hypothetical protein